jgi:hypothetical protein
MSSPRIKNPTQEGYKFVQINSYIYYVQKSQWGMLYGIWKLILEFYQKNKHDNWYKILETMRDGVAFTSADV